MIWPLLLLSSSLAYAQSERYCFSSVARMESVFQQSQAVFVPSDNLQKDGLCFTVAMRDHRRELIQNFVRKVGPDVQIASSIDALKKEPCRLKIEKEKTILADNTQVSLNSQNSLNSQGIQKEDMQIQTMGDFELKYNQEVIQGNCRYITPERYSIRIEVRTDPIPVLTNTFPQPDQQTSKLSTLIEIKKGDRIDLGGIFRSLKNQGHEVNLDSKAEYSQVQKSSDEKVFLSID